MYEMVRACLRREAAQLRFAPRRPRLYAGLTCAVFLIWALLGYLLPEQQWDRDRDGACRSGKGTSEEWKGAWRAGRGARASDPRRSAAGPRGTREASRSPGARW